MFQGLRRSNCTFMELKSTNGTYGIKRGTLF